MIFSAFYKALYQFIPHPSKHALLNTGLSYAMQWGKSWLQPIQTRMKQRYPFLSACELDELNQICQKVMSAGHGLVYEVAEKSGKLIGKEDFAATLLKQFAWINDRNLRAMFQQGRYYAWKDGVL